MQPMKISVKDLHKPLKVDVAGDEPWLDAVYESFSIRPDESFAPGVGQTPRRLVGELDIAMNSYGYVSVRGTLKYVPLVACSRCDLVIPFNVSQDFEACFKPASAGQALDERNSDARDLEQDVDVILTADDLDARFIEDGQVDIESLINDVVQTAVPAQTCQTDDKGLCCHCGVDTSTSKVFSSLKDGEPDPTSPFAKLADFKARK